jgi:hypothetical protein
LCQKAAVQTSPAIERLMRLLVLQGPEVSGAVSFLDDLRPMLHAELAKHPLSPELISEIDLRLDAFKQLASELFAASRQLLGDLRARETKCRTAVVGARMGRQAREMNL